MVNVLRRLLDAGLAAEDVAVITPYSAQVKLLQQQLRQGALAELEVRSVDGFQGREKEVVIFSAVRANARGGVGFLADARRLNVALTRAKRGLVVVGNSNTLRRDRLWRAWLDWAAFCTVGEEALLTETID